MNRAELRAALAHPNVAAFLRVIRQGETSQEDDAYRMQYGGKLFEAPPWQHPREKVTLGRWTSSAAGAYQFLAGTWEVIQTKYGFPDFSPECQDEGAVALIHGRKALAAIIAGSFDEAVALCAKEWASLPGSPYGQPTMTIEKARSIYLQWGGSYPQWGGTFAPEPVAPSKEVPVPAPLIMALLPSLLELIPALASVFKPGSEVAQRNVAAATIVADAVVKATGTPNVQAAIERMGEDPAALAAARAAVDSVWGSLVETGGGGIAQARKDASSTDQLPFYKNPAFVFWMTVAPLVYAGTYAVLFGPGNFSDDAKMMVLTALFTGILGAGTGFFLGSSLGSQRKDQQRAAP